MLYRTGIGNPRAIHTTCGGYFCVDFRVRVHWISCILSSANSRPFCAVLCFNNGLADRRIRIISRREVVYKDVHNPRRWRRLARHRQKEADITHHIVSRHTLRVLKYFLILLLSFFFFFRYITCAVIHVSVSRWNGDWPDGVMLSCRWSFVCECRLLRARAPRFVLLLILCTPTRRIRIRRRSHASPERDTDV